MKEFWNLIQFVFTAVGGWLGYFIGGCDGLLIALVVFHQRSAFFVISGQIIILSVVHAEH